MKRTILAVLAFAVYWPADYVRDLLRKGGAELVAQELL
jgi:hypothetical protein